MRPPTGRNKDPFFSALPRALCAFRAFRRLGEHPKTAQAPPRQPQRDLNPLASRSMGTQVPLRVSVPRACAPSLGVRSAFFHRVVALYLPLLQCNDILGPRVLLQHGTEERFRRSGPAPRRRGRSRGPLRRRDGAPSPGRGPLALHAPALARAARGGGRRRADT